jgi:hypothetical protein
MDLLRLFVLSTVLAPVSFCSPVERPEAPRQWAVEGESPPLTTAPPAIIVVVERREALDIGPPAGGNVDFYQPSGKGCTTTVSETCGFPCEWDGTTTLYPAGTTTQYRQVDCHGCDAVYVSRSWYYCPNQKINGTRTMDVPSTYWSTICRPSATALEERGQQQTAAAPTAVPKAGAQQTAVPAPNLVLAALPTPRA